MTALALLAEALRTKKQYGVGLSRQLWQATRLRWSGNRLDPWEYYFFRVFLDRYRPDEKRRFIGWRREIALDRSLNRGPARELANDKLEFANFMHGHDVPTPPIVAVFDPGGRNFPGAARLGDEESVAVYLADSDAYPLFVKPIRGAQGWGARAISGVSPDGTSLEFPSGEPATISDFVAELTRNARRGFLLQELLCTDPRIGEVCGARLTSMRVVILMEDRGPAILSAVWRVPTGTNVTDNFSVGSSGNLIAGVDLETGEVANVVQGVGWENRPVPRHPDTGVAFDGLRLPDWRPALDLCRSGAARVPELRLQHWDVALTDRGPVVLELNVEGGLRTHQIVAAGPGRLRRLADIAV